MNTSPLPPSGGLGQPPGASHANGAAQRVPRTLLLARLLWRCVFCIFAVVAGNAVLMAVPQAREALHASLRPDVDGALALSHIAFVAAMLYWAVSAWLVTRLLLSRKFSNDGLGATSADAPFLNWVAAALPRLLAFLALLPVSLLTWQINWMLGAITFACSFLVIALLVMRTRFGGVTEDNSYGSFDFMGPASRQAIWGFMALSVTLLGGLWVLPVGQGLAALWLVGALALRQWDGHRIWKGLCPAQSDKTAKEALDHWSVLAISLIVGVAMLGLMLACTDEIELARRLTSPAILLLAMGSWTLFGGFVLTYLPLSCRWIGLATWLPPVLFVAFGGSETHFVAQRGPVAQQLSCPGAGPSIGDWRSCRLTAAERFSRWVRQVPSGEPVYMVVAVGGASRAAYWTGGVLARLEDDVRRNHRRFAANLFAISSISGGSLGATAFVAALAQYGDAHACMQDVEPADGIHPDTCLTDRLIRFLGGDFLSPVVARMLFPDLAIRFWPVPQAWAAQADRSLGLELAWAQDWRVQSSKAAHPVDWNQPIVRLYDQGESPDAPRLPSLLLNTVRLEDGQRFMQSNVKPAWPGMMDLLDAQLDTQRLTLAQAVHNSARFPYVSPGALVLGAAGAASQAKADPPRLGHLGDGGYHEGSGAATLADLLEALLAQGQLRTEPKSKGLWACAAGWNEVPGLAGCQEPSPVVALILDSEPASFPADYVRDLDGQALNVRDGMALGSMFLPEALGPVFGGLSTRTQLSQMSQRRLSRLVGSDPSALIELRMPFWRLSADPAALAKICDGHLAQPSMNWKLDACSLARMDMAADGTPAFGPRPALAEQALQRNHQRLRQRVGIAAATPASAGRS